MERGLHLARHGNAAWRRFLVRLVAFRDDHGHGKVPARWRKDPALARWVLLQRRQFKSGTLSPARRRALEAAGFSWDASAARQDDRWEKRFAEVVAIKARHDHVRIPIGADRGTSRPLQAWVLRQRRKHREGLLDPERERRLEEIGFVWDALEARWDDMLAQFATWRAQHHHRSPPSPRHGRSPLAV
jgi:hypothetical protein